MLIVKENPGNDYVKERGRSEGPGYAVVVKSIFYLPEGMANSKDGIDYYCDANYLYFIDHAGKLIDSIQLTGGCESDVIIKDFTQHLHFKNPLFNIATQEGSDYYKSQFISFQHDSLKILFEVEGYGPAELDRKDEHTLTGTIWDRDELVYTIVSYPFTVSLDDYKVEIIEPANQKIDYETELLEDLNGYRLSTENTKTKYLLKKGTTVLIDSFNRNENIVRLLVNDTIVVYAPVSEIAVRTNSAG